MTNFNLSPLQSCRRDRAPTRCPGPTPSRRWGSATRLSTEEIPETALRQRSLELQTRRHQRHRRRRRSCTAEAASVVQLLNRRRRFGPTSAGTRELRRLQFADGHSLRHPQRPRLRSSNSGRTTSPCLDRCTATTSTATTTWWRKAWTRRCWPRGWTMAATSWQPR